MNGQDKEEDTPHVPKHQCVRAEKELYRVCPSKLSKRELEDLYFTLLENNLELKRVNNSQQEKIKLLSTKVQRMTATQRTSAAKEQKDCCANTKALVNEHKGSIAELKRANERLSERIRVLNMRLCSAKQFLKRSPPASTSRCAKCCGPSGRNSTSSVMNSKRSDTNLQISVSSQCIGNEKGASNVPTKIDESYKWFSGLVNYISSATVGTTTANNEKENPQKTCEENKCQTLIEELKQKIADLQEELSRTHEEYTSRITRLEEEASRLKCDNLRLRDELAAAQHLLQQRDQTAADQSRKLRAAEAKQSELETQLTIEKRKVSELEAHARAVDMSRNVAATIQRHASNTSQIKNEEDRPQLESISSPYFTPRWDNSPVRLERPSEYRDTKDLNSELKTFDDSGYIDANKSLEEDREKELHKLNEALLGRISLLQEQMKDLKLSTSNADSGVLASKQIKRDNISDDNRSVRSTKVPESSSSKIEEKKKLEPEDQEIENEEKKHFALTKTLKDVDSNLELETPRKILSLKPDTHNGLQIPGPLPVDSDTNPVDNTKEKTRTSKVKQLNNRKSKRRSITRNIYSDASTSPDKGDTALKTSHDNVSMIFESDRPEREDDSPVTTDYKKVSRGLMWPDSRAEDERKAADIKLTFSEKVVQTEDSANVETDSEEVNKVDTAMGADDGQENDSDFVLCEQHARICKCKCRVSPRRDVSVFRTCSGTLRFRANAASGPKLKQCACYVQRNNIIKPATGGHRESAAGVSWDQRLLADSNPAPAAPLAGPSHRSRATSPDNTEAEISSMTDLPSEKDSKSPRVLLSPGEDKATTTYTDSYTQPATDYASLSEGELPLPVKDKRPSSGEVKVNFALADPITQRMDEALRAVGQELTRCRELLRERNNLPIPPPKTQPRASRDVGLMTDTNQGAPLRRKTGTPSIGDSYAPKCIFTLHIGTVVLSDEAVINSRHLSLMLMWKFFDHDVAMTRMCAGRVILFDFSTEYTVRITPEFLNYLKSEEMPILICELDKQNDAFAWCSLPLRDALLHTNRRADMSLALMAGPRLRRARPARDSLDSSDEVGVLDLWCTLRVDPGMLPAVNQAIATTSTTTASVNTTDNLEASANMCAVNQSDDENSDGWLNRRLATASKCRKSSLNNLDNAAAAAEHFSAGSQNTYGYHKRMYNKALNLSSQHTQSTVHINLKNEVPTKIKTEDGWEHSINKKRVASKKQLPKISDQRANVMDTASSTASKRNTETQKDDNTWSKCHSTRSPVTSCAGEPPELIRGLAGNYRMLNTSKKLNFSNDDNVGMSVDDHQRSIQVTILWLALNDECDAMVNPNIQRLYVAYEFLGHSGAELETPLSLPKPKGYADKCLFNFSKTFHLQESDLPLIVHMAKCRSNGKTLHDAKDCIVFTVISEPLEDPLGVENCQDIGYAYLYLGDLLACSGGNNSYTEVLPVRSARVSEPVCGVLAVRLDGLDAVRRCLLLTMADAWSVK